MACVVVGHMLGLAAKNVESGVFRLKFVIFVFELFGELYVAVHALSRDTDGVSFIEFNHWHLERTTEVVGVIVLDQAQVYLKDNF